MQRIDCGWASLAWRLCLPWRWFVILDLRADKRSAQCAALCFALLIMALPYVAASMLLGH